MNPRSNPFLRWLHHTGVPLARPGLLLFTLSALLLTTLAYTCVMMADDTLVRVAEKHMPEITTEGRELLRQSRIHQSIFRTSLLLGGLFCLARGWRFSRRFWLLILVFVALSDFWRVLVPAVSLIVSLVLGTPLSQIPSHQWTPLLPTLLIACSFLVLTLLLFLPPISRWRKALRQLAGTTIPSTP
ncbi:MAG: hypothetical protein H7293_02695 [Candidatus Saccharibacteria bacterium]|nr:hypothetical protein [Rhodoferax sp.]